MRDAVLDLTLTGAGGAFAGGTLPEPARPAGLHDVDRFDDLQLQRLADPGAGFPSPQLVAAAAAMFDTSVVPSARIQDGREGRDFLVAVSAGCVGVRLVDGERRARTEARTRLTRELARFNEDTQKYEIVLRTPSRVITEWSKKSRREMTRALSELDYAPLFDKGLPAMLTLTYPGDWVAVAPSGAESKKHLRALMKRWTRSWGEPPSYLWKLEFQRRGAPHYHLFAVPVAGEVACSCCEQLLEFRAWLSHQWADVVAADDRHCHTCHAGGACWGRSCCPGGCRCGDLDTERHRHRLAGAGIDYREGARARDPKRLAVYFTKHGGAAGGKEYQHQVPVEWRVTGRGPGRFWGYCVLSRVRSEVYVDQDAYYRIRRTLRRLSASQGLTKRSRVLRVDTSTGEVRWRTVTRRYVHLDHGGAAGGWLLVNDGPSLAAQLALWAVDDPPG